MNQVEHVCACQAHINVKESFPIVRCGRGGGVGGFKVFCERSIAGYEPQETMEEGASLENVRSVLFGTRHRESGRWERCRNVRSVLLALVTGRVGDGRGVGT